ncbi:accessory Sec system protein Asp3 [Streptococcus merionis]|uniref:accessory Sec system protein Asp3 n=1 Tax=Streptococcus merionis TaxID=400065 RepID=UPI0026E9ECF9|nr:accessory Sec system protein Asp3 [Streptococcus merionis]
MTRSEKLIHSITWDTVSGTSYLYGSAIQVSSEGVRFKNPRMASGTVIQSWQSKINYQGSRTTVQLPLLIPGVTYRLESQVQTVPEQRIYYRISFYNRQDEEIHFVVHKTAVGEFVCPKETYTYQIQLISAGCQEVLFKSLNLYQMDRLTAGTSGLSQSTRPACHLEAFLPADLQFLKPLLEPHFSKENASHA